MYAIRSYYVILVVKKAFILTRRLHQNLSALLVDFALIPIQYIHTEINTSIYPKPVWKGWGINRIIV